MKKNKSIGHINIIKSRITLKHTFTLQTRMCQTFVMFFFDKNISIRIKKDIKEAGLNVILFGSPIDTRGQKKWSMIIML